MIYTLVNKNLLIPQIEVFNDLESSIHELMNLCYNVEKQYLNNIYVVYENKIFFTDGTDIFYIVENKITKYDYKLFNKSQMTTINNFLNNNTNEKKMDIVINAKQNNIKIIDEQPKKVKEKTKEELQIMKLCEETMALYENEQRKMKEIEQKLKILENTNKNLIKRKREKTLSNFSKLKNDYKTFTTINKKLKTDPETVISKLFSLKYDYFNNLIKNEYDSELLKEIEEINLDEVLNTDYQLKNEIEKMSNDYEETSKKLNVKFDHSWEELEYDTSEMNNSKLGS
jgi:hypothetical protein